jgi:large subunit ribosomal protein L5e
MKGAADGGLNVPHSYKRFPGYTKARVEEVVNKRGKATGETEKQDAKFEAEKHKDRIFGNHIFNYMTQLKKEDKEKYTRQFKNWDKCLADNKAKSCSDLYKKVHTAILANSDRQKVKAKTVNKPKATSALEGLAKVYTDAKGKKWLRYKKITKEQKTARVAARFASLMQ